MIPITPFAWMQSPRTALGSIVSTRRSSSASKGLSVSPGPALITPVTCTGLRRRPRSKRNRSSRRSRKKTSVAMIQTTPFAWMQPPRTRLDCIYASIEQCKQGTIGTSGTCFNNPHYVPPPPEAATAPRTEPAPPVKPAKLPKSLKSANSVKPLQSPPSPQPAPSQQR